MGSNTVDLFVTPQAYFQEKVSSAISTLKVDVDNHLEFYLVNLLCEFIDTQKLKTIDGDSTVMDMPLALMLKQAVESPTYQRIKILKQIGDTSLYVSGFFQDYFNRKTFDIGYYIEIGSTAYGTVSTMLRDQHNDEAMGGLYRDLSNRFGNFVDIVAEVSEAPKGAQDIDILAVYDRWARSNSARLRRILEQSGINPIEVHMRIAQ